MSSSTRIADSLDHRQRWRYLDKGCALRRSTGGRAQDPSDGDRTRFRRSAARMVLRRAGRHGRSADNHPPDRRRRHPLVNRSKTPATGRAAPGALPVDCEKYGMTFLSSTTGWVAGGCRQRTPFFYVTHNGGARWSPQAIDCGANCYLDPPQFTSELDGYMTGQIGTAVLFATKDGGRTWNRVPVRRRSTSISSTRPRSRIGFNGNDNPAAILWRTDDGGMTWSEAPNGAIEGPNPRTLDSSISSARQPGGTYPFTSRAAEAC